MIRIKGDKFVDEHGRALMLRGVNLGGSSKVPRTPDGATWIAEGFFNHRTVSFVGRPFPLAEADEHFSRLQRWGLTFVRLIVTWEAIEHAGPGRYDEQYLEYVREIVKRAAKRGISVFIDPHQDAWSRFSGGDGAPGWTLEAVGLDMRTFAETGAAITHQTHGDPFPRMIWPTNYGRLANLTMWTLFFGGNDFAPDTQVSGVPVQDYLQGHYIRAIEELADRLKGMYNVIGFDTLNEPSAGLIGLHDLERETGTPMRLGPSPTALQALALGDGIPQKVDVYKLRSSGFARAGSKRVDPAGKRAWQEGAECVWRANGVWDVAPDGTPRLLRPDYFTRVGDREVDFNRDYYLPFARRYTAAIRRHIPHTAIFLEGAPDGALPLEQGAISNAVYAPHWYDAMTLLRKKYTPHLGADPFAGKVLLGARAVERSFAGQIATLVDRGRSLGMPTLIGEAGIPFDMDGKRAFRTGNFSHQVRALDATMRAIESSCANVTLWNYTADNSNERGDQWNDEDLSIFSRDQQHGTGSLDDGGRALEAAVRPYPIAVPGEVLSVSFDVKRRAFSCSFRLGAHLCAPAEFFVPELHYPDGCVVDAPDGEATIKGQRLTYAPNKDAETHRVSIRPK